jgi:hypothetical protein
MYSKQEASQIRKDFWTRLGQYMRPIAGANGDTINWVNYKTGVRHLYFRMDADKEQAAIAIELRHPDAAEQQRYFEQLQQLKNMLEETVGETWSWELHSTDEDGKLVSRIGTCIKTVSVFKKEDWPVMISFLKPRLLAIDTFWNMVKDGFE